MNFMIVPLRAKHQPDLLERLSSALELAEAAQMCANVRQPPSCPVGLQLTEGLAATNPRRTPSTQVAMAAKSLKVQRSMMLFPRWVEDLQPCVQVEARNHLCQAGTVASWQLHSARLVAVTGSRMSSRFLVSKRPQGQHHWTPYEAEPSC